MRRSPMSDSIHIMPVSVVASKSVQLFGQPSAEAREYPLVSELRAVLRNVARVDSFMEAATASLQSGRIIVSVRQQTSAKTESIRMRLSRTVPSSSPHHNWKSTTPRRHHIER